MTPFLEQEIEDALRCPECKGRLLRKNSEDAYYCQDHGVYQIREGVLSFIENHAFDKHWLTQGSKELPHSKIEAATRFFNVLPSDGAGLTEPWILDAGCGDGVHKVAIRHSQLFSEDAVCFGLDVSMQALQLARRRNGNGWIFIHGDMGKLPFDDNRFDIVYSYGSLSYTEDPFHTFGELSRVLKPGAYLGIWMYPKQHGFGGWLLSGVRKLCKLTGETGTQILANLIVPFLPILPTQSGIHLGNASWEQCREVVMVNIAPAQILFPEPENIRRWFREYAVRIIAEDNENPITLWGRKAISETEPPD